MQQLFEVFVRDVDVFALALATGENDGDLLTTVEETIEEVDKLLMDCISWLMHFTIAEGLNLPIMLTEAQGGVRHVHKDAWDSRVHIAHHSYVHVYIDGDVDDHHDDNDDVQVLDTSTKMLGMVVSIFLIILILVCLTACLCYCCHKVCGAHHRHRHDHHHHHHFCQHQHHCC